MFETLEIFDINWADLIVAGHDIQTYRVEDMSETVIVGVAQGDLRGRRALTKSGLQYYSFQGIPYAKPPVGNLRFKVSNFIQNLLPHS
jgi:hypothetical protein